MKKRAKTKHKLERHDIFWALALMLLVAGATGNLIKPINRSIPDLVDYPNKFVIKNLFGADLVGILDEQPESNGVAIISHGLGGDKDKPDILAIADTFKSYGFTVVRYDASNSRGESGGYMEDAKATTYVQDMMSIMNWAKEQPWFKQPLVLAGHSLGATASALYTEAHSGEVAGLVLISGVVSATLHLQETPERTPSEWEQTWRQIGGQQQSELGENVNWLAFVIDLLRFDVLKNVDDLGMPVLIIVGEKDELAPPVHQQRLYESLPGPKELQVVAGTGHTFQSDADLFMLKSIIGGWLVSKFPESAVFLDRIEVGDRTN